MFKNSEIKLPLYPDILCVHQMLREKRHLGVTSCQHLGCGDVGAIFNSEFFTFSNTFNMYFNKESICIWKTKRHVPNKLIV
jgi:hypothetical protein